MADSRRRKHRAETTPNQTHAKAGLTALASVLTVITVVLVAVGSLFAPSGAAPAAHRWPAQTVTVTKTVTATVTAIKTVWGPTATTTTTKTPVPTSSATKPSS